MLPRNFHCRTANDNAIWGISIKSFYMQLGFNRKLYRVFLILLILTSLMTLCYTVHLIHLSFYDKLSRNAKSKATLLPQNTTKISENEKQKLITKVQLILYQIQTLILQISNFAHEVFSSLRWNLFIKLDLRTIPLMMNYTNDVTDDTLFIYKAFLDLRRKEPLIRLLAFSQCRDINVILHYGLQCISAKDVTIEYDCPWKWVPECKWFSFMLIFNMRHTNFSINTVSILK